MHIHIRLIYIYMYMHTYNLFTYIYFLIYIYIYISIFKNVAIWKYILNIYTFSLPSRRDEKRKGIYIQYVFSNIYIFSNIHMCIYTYIWSRKRENQSHRKVVLLISSTFKYTYIYIYTFDIVLFLLTLLFLEDIS